MSQMGIDGPRTNDLPLTSQLALSAAWSLDMLVNAMPCDEDPSYIQSSEMRATSDKLKQIADLWDRG